MGSPQLDTLTEEALFVSSSGTSSRWRVHEIQCLPHLAPPDALTVQNHMLHRERQLRPFE